MNSEWGGDANDYGIYMGDFTEVSCGCKTVIDHFRNISFFNVLDVRLATIQYINFFFVNIKADSFEANFRKADGERKTDVAEADDGNCIFSIYY